MHSSLTRRLFELFTASLVGYSWGWIVGWVSFDPNTDVWALLAALGALIGLALGVTGAARRLGLVLIGSTLGLFAGFWLHALVFGDVSGPGGLLVTLAFAAAGGWGAGSLQKPDRLDWMPVFLAVLYGGFFGGFLIDVLILDLLLGWVSHHSIVTQGLWVLAGGLATGVVVQRMKAHG